MTDGPFTPEEARKLNAEGIQTAGCWRCIKDTEIFVQNGGTAIDPRAETQWRYDILRSIGHRFFCPNHFTQEMKGARDF